MLLELPAAIVLLMVANALCNGLGMCARSPGRPFIALGPLLLVALPVMVACVMIGGFALLLLTVISRCCI